MLILSKSDQVVRGATVLPNGTGGKTVRVAVFAQGATMHKKLTDAGADVVGFDDLG